MGGDIYHTFFIYPKRSDWNRYHLFSDFACFVGSVIENYKKIQSLNHFLLRLTLKMIIFLFYLRFLLAQQQ